MKLSYEYIAGFFDADGCVSCSLIDQSKYRGRSQNTKMKKSTMMPHVGFCNQNLGVLRDIMETLECGDILACIGNRRRGNTGAYRVEIPNSDIARVLNALLPYLRVKREQAIVMFMLLETRKTGAFSKGLDPAVIEQREALTAKLRELNHADSQAYRTKWVNSVELSKSCRLVARYETTPSQAATPLPLAEGVETSPVTGKNNLDHEPPPRKGRHSPLSTVM